MFTIDKLWQSRQEQDWKQALDYYWNSVKKENLELERHMDKLCLDSIRDLDPEGWYRFLHDEYFRWKYTAPNRYSTTTVHLSKYRNSTNGLPQLFSIKEKILALDLNDIYAALSVVTKIRGLGIAGASGLLSILYPQSFGTVDQFVVKALQAIPGLPEHEQLMRISPDCQVTATNGVLLIEIMRRKARENNRSFGNNDWTPRKIDMVLWGRGYILPNR
jgi:hypothetical protein